MRRLIMDKRQQYVKIYEENEKLISSYYFQETKYSIDNSIWYKTSPKVWVPNENEFDIKVVNSGCVDEALKFPTATILNFASAKHPGGGYIRGAIAQEEAICRCSNLYNVLKEFDEHYSTCPASNLYNDNMIYSKDILFFRDGQNNLMSFRKFDVITAAMPKNTTEGNLDSYELEAAYDRRIFKMLKIAETHKTENLILGAWGCGVFNNDPETISKMFKYYLTTHNWNFKNVVFAVLDKHPNKLYNIFKERLV